MNVPASCPICNCKLELLYRDVRSQYASFKSEIYKCSQCGHGITYPAPNKEQLDDIYKSSYSTKDHLFAIKEKSSRARNWVEIVLSKINPDFVVDIGSMFGTLILEFRRVGILGIGIEQDHFAAAYAKSLGIETLNVDIFNTPKSEKLSKVDLISLTHVLEHFENPVEAINKMLILFPKAQYIFIVVPNFDSRFSKWLGPSWGSLQIGTHFHHFSPISIELFLESIDLEIIDKRVMPGDSLLYISTIINLLKITRKNFGENFLSTILKKTVSNFLLIPAKLLGLVSKDEILVIARVRKNL